MRFQNGLIKTWAPLLMDFHASCTPFENAQRWMGQNTLNFLLLNDDNMIGEHQETRIEMPNMCPFEKREKEVFFRLTTFFFMNKKNFFQGTTFVQFLMYY